MALKSLPAPYCKRQGVQGLGVFETGRALARSAYQKGNWDQGLGANHHRRALLLKFVVRCDVDVSASIGRSEVSMRRRSLCGLVVRQS